MYSHRGFLYDQLHLLHFASVLGARGDDIYSGGVDAGMTEDVGKLSDISLNPIERSRKEMAQIMGKDLIWQYVSLLAQSLHLAPDGAAAYGSSASGHKDGPRSDP